MEQLEHPAITYILKNGEPPIEVVRVADGICMAVDVDTDEDISERSQNEHL